MLTGEKDGYEYRLVPVTQVSVLYIKLTDS